MSVLASLVIGFANRTRRISAGGQSALRTSNEVRGGQQRRMKKKRPDQKTKPLHATLSFAGPVAQAGRQYPIPSRTRPSNSPAPMVLCLKTRESRSSPGPQMTDNTPHDLFSFPKKGRKTLHTQDKVDAGWSSPVARQAHNLKVAGSNPAPATRT